MYICGALISMLALTGAMSHSKEVCVERIPAERGDSHLTCSVKLEPPEWEQGSLVLLVFICTILIVLEVCKKGEGEESCITHIEANNLTL